MNPAGYKLLDKLKLTPSIMFDSVSGFVFLMGIIITSVFLYGLKLYRDEIKQAYQEEKESKLSYRSNEEFVGRD